MTYRIGKEAKGRMAEKRRDRRTERIAYLEQQLKIFQSDIDRFKLQLEEARLVENVKGR